MLFALVHAEENAVLEDIAKDFRRQRAKAGLICMESKERAAQLKVLLEKEERYRECKYKVVNGPRPPHGSVGQYLRGCGGEFICLLRLQHTSSLAAMSRGLLRGCGGVAFTSHLA